MKYIVYQNSRTTSVRLNIIGIYDTEQMANAVINKVRSKLLEKTKLTQDTELFVMPIEENKTYSFEYSVGDNDIKLNGQLPEVKNLITKTFDNGGYLPF